MASYRRRSGRIQVRWRDLAGAQRSHTVPNLRTARQVIREIEESLALGYDWAPVDLRAAPTLERSSRRGWAIGRVSGDRGPISRMRSPCGCSPRG